MQLKLVSMLSGNMELFIRELAGYLSSRTGLEVASVDHVPWQEREWMLDRGEAHLGFFCGLYYVRKVERPDPALELLAAPVMRGERYGGRPVYFSEVVVRRDSHFRTFSDLRGESWSYNEPHSHSGYNLVRYHLARLGESDGYFGRVVQAGSHLRSLDLVSAGAVSAAAIDTTVLEMELRARPELGARLRSVLTLGPGAIPPAVVRRDLPSPVRAGLREALLRMHEDPIGQRLLDSGLMARFTAVEDAHYDDIRYMDRRAAGVRLEGATPALAKQG
ncbi:MAG TPA: PhnD/SsuA/transferrin family substrate-binding protein [Armatimonadota bacterium]|nr:PhnD/SsuA/transferrin family substrate-binding protein [Armatimonadota bacterium]